MYDKLEKRDGLVDWKREGIDEQHEEPQVGEMMATRRETSIY